MIPSALGVSDQRTIAIAAFESALSSRLIRPVVSGAVGALTRLTDKEIFLDFDKEMATRLTGGGGGGGEVDVAKTPLVVRVVGSGDVGGWTGHAPNR